ncbi:cytochrome b5 reductase family protein [Sporobolomyces koalae]|uniref:cytochrome b5 reductase family protein n=1 Tax=Sporobolomyces koalae TaxID=500713 RepID=UPI00317B3D88
MFSRASSTVLSGARTASRGYATAASKAGVSSTAPYFLGAGLAGAVAFYYSTSSQRALLSESSSSSAAKKEAALNPDEFRSFKLAEVIPYNHNSSRFVFDLPAGTDSGLSVASALVVKAAQEGQALGKNGKPVVRPYTPTTAPNTEGKLELLVKHYPGGIMTDHMFNLKTGDELQFKGPIPKFNYKANEFESIALIAGGSGITPMWQILQQINSDPTDKTKVTLVFSNQTEDDILLRKEFEQIAANKPDQFNVVFTLDKPPKQWSGESGYLSAAVVKKALAKFGTESSKGDKVKVFVCGPPGMMGAVSGAKKSFKEQGPVEGVLKELGYNEQQTYKF